MKKHIGKIVFWTYIFFVAVLLLTCCKEKEVAAPDAVQVIEAITKPAEDSLRMRTKTLEDSLIVIRQQLARAQAKTQADKTAGQVTSGKMAAAKEKKDTMWLTQLCEEQDENFRSYVKSAEHEASVRGSEIEKLTEQVKTTAADLNLQVSKYQMLKDAWENLKQDLASEKAEGDKLESKNKFLKFWVKLFGITTAALATITAIVFL